MKVIVEGINCVGKTTFINWAANERGYKYSVFNKREDVSSEVNIVEQVEKNIIEINELRKQSKGVFIDRFHISEYAYSLVTKRRTPDQAKQIFLCSDAMLKKNKFVLSYINPCYDPELFSRVFNKTKLSYDDFIEVLCNMDKALDMSCLSMVESNGDMRKAADKLCLLYQVRNLNKVELSHKRRVWTI